MVIARNTTELRYFEEEKNYRKQRWIIHDLFYEVPKNKTLSEVFKDEYDKKHNKKHNKKD